MAKTVAIGGKNYKEGSKKANAAIASGGVATSSSSAVRANAEASKARTSARNAAGEDYAGVPLEGNFTGEQVAQMNLTPPTGGTAPKPINQPAPQAQQAQVAATGKPTLGAGSYVPGASLSVVDLLNSAGQPSDFNSRSQMAGQMGITNYTGTASQNQELARKFTELYNAKGQTAPPASPADFMDQYQSYNEENKQPQPFDEIQNAFWGTYQQMNPIEKYLFDGVSELMAPTKTKDTLREIYEEELAAQGIPGLNQELADINRIMDGTEDDIRAEVQATGGMATESQVQALTAARNKTLLRQAQYLSDLIDSKNEYVDRIVSLTQADREQTDKDIDRKLGISQMLLNFTDKLSTRARENYQNIIKDVGYNGLVSSISSPAEFDAIAKSLGMSPQTLMQVSRSKTSAQKAQELDTLKYQLSVDQFNEDKRQFGLQYSLEKQKLTEQKAAESIISPYTIEKTTRAISFVDDIRPSISNFTVGLGSLSSGIPGTAAADFKAKVSALESAISFGELAEMRDASKTGGALGSIAIKELELLGSSLGALSTAQSPAQFSKSLDKVEENLYRWNVIKISTAKGFDYKSAQNAGWNDKDIYNYLTK